MTGPSAPEKVIEIREPLIIMFKDDDGKIITRIHAPPDMEYTHYGLLICDLVRHIAKAFKVDEGDVWEWVDKERRHPTTSIVQAS